MMSWLLLFHDPDNIVDDKAIERIANAQQELADVLNLDIVFLKDPNIGSLIDEFIRIYKDETLPEKTIIAYDGHWGADGIANQSTFAISYNEEVELNHHTRSLVDAYTTYRYTPEMIDKLLAEVVYLVYYKFAQLSSEEKDGLKKIFGG